MNGLPKLGPVIAIDGPAGTGKSSTTRALAKKLNFVHVDSGALYRSVAWAALQRDLLDDGKALDEAQLVELTRQTHIEFRNDPKREPVNRVWVNSQDVTAEIRSPEVTQWASKVSAIPGVRAALLGLQRRLGCAGPSVLEGRDIGTVIFPDADVKFFLTASVEERAKRRLLEMPGESNLEAVKKAIEERDQRDSQRDIAPLRKAEDAIELDTSNLTLEQVLAKMEAIVRKRISL